MFKSGITKEREDSQIQLNNSLDEYKKISEKKYNIIDILAGTRKDDRVKLKNIQNKIDTLKSKLEEIDKDFKEAELEYKELEKQEYAYKQEKQELYSKLEREFKDFTLNPDLDDIPYINGRYYLKVSLDRLIDKEDEYREKLRELQQMKNFTAKNIEAAKEIEQDKNLDYEY